jgi:N-acetylglutamate synthase-like GNAT family acetyltransferase
MRPGEPGESIAPLPSSQPPAPSSTAIRRAVDADAPAIAALLPQGRARDAATFVLEDAGGLIGVLVLSQSDDRLWIEAIAVAAGQRRRGHGRTLLAFAEAAAREIGLRLLQFRSTEYSPFFVTQGFSPAPTFLKKLPRGGALHRAMQHLEAVGVPLLAAGSALPARTLYYRGVWAGLALFIGLGNLALAASASPPTPGRAIFAVAFGAVCVLFALWQTWLMVAVTRTGGVIAVLAIAATLYGKAVPQIRDITSSLGSDATAGDFQVSTAGATLQLKGTPGAGADSAVRRALEADPAIREVVLEGAGDGLDPAYEISRLIHNRRLATHIDRSCAGACAIMFLGGAERSVSGNAVLSFRQAGLPGMNKVQAYERNQQLEKLLAVQAGLEASFVQRVLATPIGSVWTPSIDELLAGRVIKRAGPAKEQSR